MLYIFLPHNRYIITKRKHPCTRKSNPCPNVSSIPNNNPSTALALYGQNFVLYFSKTAPPGECFSVPATLL